jgi:hypothetical protein
MEGLKIAPRRLSWRKVLLLLLAGVGVVLLCLQFFAGPTVPQQELMLDDGTTFSLMGITYGTNHVLDDRSMLKRILSQVPANWLSNVGIDAGCPIDQRSSETTMLGFWLRVEDGDVSAPPFGFAHLSDPEQRMYRHTYSDMTWWCQKKIYSCLFDVFPRRSKYVLLSLYPGSCEGQFKIENPYYSRNLPVWKGPPLPLTVKSGDVEITLSKLTTFNACRTMAEIEIRQHGLLFTNWEMGLEDPVSADWVYQVEYVEDATGNKLDAFRQREVFKDGRSTLFFEDCLDPSESAWKLVLTYLKRGSYMPGELWNIQVACTNIFLIDGFNSESNRVIARTHLLGIDWELAGSRWRSEDLQTYRAEFSVVAEESLYSCSVVSVMDSQGRPLTNNSAHFVFSPDVEYGWFLGNETNSLNITVGFGPCGTVEFLAKPSPPEVGSR